VAVAAEKLKVLEAVVMPVTVDVMELQPDRLPEPGVETTGLADSLLEPCAEEPRLDVVSTTSPAGREDLLDRPSGWSRNDLAARYGLVPGRTVETELSLALPDAESGVVRRLDRGPVVSPVEAAVCRYSEAAGVITDRRRAQIEDGCNLRLGVACCEAAPLPDLAYSTRTHVRIPARRQDAVHTIL